MAHRYVDELTQRGKTALGQVRGQPGAALKLVLNEMPVRAAKVDKDKAAYAAAKDVAAASVLSVLTAVEGTKLAGAVKELNDEERDTLMKFVYRGFAERKTVTEEGKGEKSVPVYDCNILLKAHEEISKLSGNGPIIRSIHTRLEV
jgi:actin related protein 2/3 complex subunit 5